MRFKAAQIAFATQGQVFPHGHHECFDSGPHLLIHCSTNRIRQRKSHAIIILFGSFILIWSLLINDKIYDILLTQF